MKHMHGEIPTVISLSLEKTTDARPFIKQNWGGEMYLSISGAGSKL